ncbi:MAG TPA: hypothetical protein VGM05_26950 [Planctomycetaceae bacterium]|jgi:hypothetical protein
MARTEARINIELIGGPGDGVILSAPECWLNGPCPDCRGIILVQGPESLRRMVYRVRPDDLTRADYVGMEPEAAR